MRTHAALAALLAAALPAAAGDLAEVRKRGVIRAIVAADEQKEMFNAGPSGEPGFERELLEGFARLHKLKVEPVVVARYDDRIPALLEDRGDLVVGIIKTEARLKQIDFTVETLPTRRVVVTHAPHRVVRTAEGLKEEKVGILKGTTTWFDAAVEAGVPAGKIELLPDLPSVVAALEAGKITATVMSVSDLGLAMRKNPGLQPGAFLGPPGSAGWGVRKQDVELRRALDAYLTGARKTTWSRLVVRYFGEEALLVLGRAGQ